MLFFIFSEVAVRYEPQANKKFFDPAIFQKCWRGVGEQPTFAEQIGLVLKIANKNLRENHKKSQLPLKSKGCNEIQGFRGNCDSQGKLGMCPSLAEPDWSGIPKNNVLHETIQEQLLEKTIFSVRQKSLCSFAFVLFAGGCVV